MAIYDCSHVRFTTYEIVLLFFHIIIGLTVTYPEPQNDEESKFRLESNFNNPDTKRAYHNPESFIYAAKYTPGKLSEQNTSVLCPYVLFEGHYRKIDCHNVPLIFIPFQAFFSICLLSVLSDKKILTSV